MKKELLKGFTMLTLIIVIALATAVVSANAQSSSMVVSNIPFEFIVGDQTLPAGEYRITQTLANGLTIQSLNASYSVIRLTNVLAPRRNKTRALLVFHKYGERSFLAEVWIGKDDKGRQLTKSRQERAIERELATIASKCEQAESAYELVEVVAVYR